MRALFFFLGDYFFTLGARYLSVQSSATLFRMEEPRREEQAVRGPPQLTHRLPAPRAKRAQQASTRYQPRSHRLLASHFAAFLIFSGMQ